MINKWDNFVSETTAIAEAIAKFRSSQHNLPESWKAISADCPSTGGSGNKLPIIVPPIVIAVAEELGLNTKSEKKLLIPKMSTRGIPGGTINILESVGYNAEISLERYKRIVEFYGYSNIKPTNELAPLDEMLMDLRKEVGMIRHPQLVVASILGKKLATNCGKLVIEVKNGIESKMHFPGVPPNVATEYGAQLFLEVGKNLGMEIICLITDGNRPQGKFIGNKIALLEVISILQGKTNTTVVSNSLFELAKQTSLEMLKLADKTLSELNIMTEIEKVIRNLKAFELFIAQMKEHGAIEIEDLNRNGDKLIKEIEKLLPDSDRRTVIALKTGVITKIDVTTVDDAAKLLIVENGKIIDYEAGIVLHKQVGEKVQKKDILATICGNDDKHFKRIIEMLSTTIVIEEEAKVEKSDLVSKFAWKLGKSKEILITDWKNGNWQERVKFPL